MLIPKREVPVEPRGERHHVAPAPAANPCCGTYRWPGPSDNWQMQESFTSAWFIAREKQVAAQLSPQAGNLICRGGQGWPSSLRCTLLAAQTHQPRPYQASARLQDSNRADVDQQGLVLASELQSFPYIVIIREPEPIQRRWTVVLVVP